MGLDAGLLSRPVQGGPGWVAPDSAIASLVKALSKEDGLSSEHACPPTACQPSGVIHG